MTASTLHGKAFGLSFLLVAAAMLVVVGRTQNDRYGMHIGVEHARPLALDVTIATLARGQVVSIGNSGGETVAVSLPEEWTRGEVQGSPLAAILSDPPSLGYVRWRLPPKTDVSFRARRAGTAFTFHNPSGIPLTVRVTTIDLDANRSELDAM